MHIKLMHTNDKTSAYQALKLGPLSWEMFNSFAEDIFRLINIIMYSVFYIFMHAIDDAFTILNLFNKSQSNI